MLPLALLAEIGLPFLVRAVGGALGLIDNPVAKAASEALDKAGAAMSGGDIKPEQIAEANRHIERMAAIESEEARTALRQVNRTMRAEVRSDDAYVRRWRPTFGYAVALTWTAQTAALVWAVVATPASAGPIIAAMSGLSVMWGIALSVLGVSVVKRSRDKAAAAGLADGTGLLETLLARVAGGPDREPARKER